MSALPVAPSIRVLAQRTYVQTSRRWIALCVVASDFGTKLKFYKWIRRADEDRWKVDLARFSVGDVDLCQIAADAVELAREFNIALEWASLDQISSISVNVQKTPTCPNCGISEVRAVQARTSWTCQLCDHEWQTSGDSSV